MDFKTVEAKWQNAWAEQKAFEPETDPKRAKFFFTVPYPYVSGSLHVGHGRTYAVGDVFARFKRMQGFNVLWPMAFHITGTPVLAISSKIADGDAATIQLHTDYVSVYESNPARVTQIVQSFGTDPWNVVNYYSGKLVHDFSRMGYSLDLSRQFTTGDAEYNRFVQWQFHTYKGNGFITQAAYPIPYCVRDKNAVGEDDIKDGDSDPVSVQTFVGFKFAYEDGFLVSSTLRPDTVFGITNMFVRPDATYVKASVDGQVLYVSQPFAEKMRLQNHDVKVLSDLKGADLLGKNCTTPLGKTVPILPGAFVEPDHATGLVHSVPAHAPFDLVALNELKKDAKWKSIVEKIEPIPVILAPGYSDVPARDLVERMKIANLKEKGKLDKATAELYKKEFYEGTMLPNAKQFAGMKASDAKEKMTEWLKTKGMAIDIFETSRPAQCRCGGQVIAAVMADQWFLNFNAAGWKEKATRCLSQMEIFPPLYRKQFEDVFAWLDKRPCARRRGLGTRLPFNEEWIVESLSDSTLYMAFYTVVKKIREEKIHAEKLTPAFFDYVFLGKGHADAQAKAVRAEFLYWYPNDQRHTAVAHLTNHLSFFIFAHAGILPPEQWPKAITLNEMVVSEGTKMSKSKGNVVSLNDIAENTGADLFRLYAITTADLGATLDFRAKDVDALRRRLNKLFSIWDEWTVLAKEQETNGKGKAKTVIGKSMTVTTDATPEKPLVRWMQSKFGSIIERSGTAIEKRALRDYAQTAFFEALNAAEHFATRATVEEKRHAARTLLQPWVKILCPLIPHAAEEYWEQSGGRGFASHAPWPTPKSYDGWKDEKTEAAEDFLMSVVSDIRTILPMVKKKPAKMTLIIASAQKRRQYADILKAETADQITGDSFMENFVRKRFYELKHAIAVDETAILTQSRAYLQTAFGVPFDIVEEDATDNPRKEKALPGKPAVYVE
ncbi:leucine--tRNA ligase [Candidatus Micrarchaeota archaeon]|nr:leucine--tRNA ligase [Candidatus Micrarchaeota archaeon]